MNATTMTPMRMMKPDDALRSDLAGFPEAAVESVLVFSRQGGRDALVAMVRRVLAFYLPRGAATDLTTVPRAARLREDLGLDSLALSEAVFKLDDLTGVPFETSDAARMRTIGEVEDFLAERLLEDGCACDHGEGLEE